ncbi:WD40-repeat-containing domain protein [Lipomyces oligophaga]|uniref:WD40-repeat-containing domain protein n=1 Tax=Lipomyces oligophaga TaxID=45792 RepID=UPI0034D015BC
MAPANLLPGMAPPSALITSPNSQTTQVRQPASVPSTGSSSFSTISSAHRMEASSIPTEPRSISSNSGASSSSHSNRNAPRISHSNRNSSPSSASTAALDDWTQFLDAILQELHCPIAKYGVPANDFSVLSCGCVASEQWARSRLPNLQLKVCPNCGNPTELKKPVVPLRSIYNIVIDKRKELGLPVPEEVGSEEEVEEEGLLFQQDTALSSRLGSSRKQSPRLPNLHRSGIDAGGSNNSERIDVDSQRKSSTISGQSSSNDPSDYRVDRRPSSASGSTPNPPSPKTSLVSLFSSVARQTFANSSSDIPARQVGTSTTTNSSSQSRRMADEVDSSVTSSSFTPPSSLISQPSFKSVSQSSSSAVDPWGMAGRPTYMPVMMTPEDEAREKQFAENFPIYRKDARFPTQSSRGFSVIPRGKVFEASAISPDTRKFALVTEKRWEVYSVPTQYKLGTTPTLICVGKASGDYGAGWETCTKRDSDDRIRSIAWAQSMAALSNRFLVIAGTNGVLRVHDLDRTGAPVFTEISEDAIRCIAISDDGMLLACAVTTRDRRSGSEQPTVILHNLGQLMDISTSSGSSGKLKTKPILIDMPYRDPLKTMSFSNDGRFLACSTAMESRFMVINLYDPANPRLVIRSSRRVDPSQESEGITSVRFFAGNRYLVVSSVASDAHPILVEIMAAQDAGQSKFNRSYSSSSGYGNTANTDDDDDFAQYKAATAAAYGITSSSSNSGSSGTLLNPKLRNRFHEVGSSIHQASVSPRSNAIAFLDRSGTVYLTQFLRAESEHRRVVAVVDVTNANKLSECASMRFSPDGQKLILVDRKGVLYIEDFGALAENGETLKKCRIIK